MSKLDFSKFKKVSSDKHSTTMQHPAGHTIRIAHAPLSAKMRAELDGIQAAPAPEKFARGGHIHQQNIPNYSKNIPHLANGTPDNTINKKAVVDSMVKFGTPAATPAAAAKQYPAGEFTNPEDAADYAIEQTAEEAKHKASKVIPTQGNMAQGGKVCAHCGEDPTQEHLAPGDVIPNRIEKQVVSKARSKFDQGGGVEPTKTVGQIINYPGSQPSPKPSQSPKQNYDVGGAVESGAAPAQDVPPQDTRTPEQQALNSLYNQKVQQLSLTPGDPAEQERIKTEQFGPNGEPPANFNATAAQAANSAYQRNQAAEVANKQAATFQMQKANEIRASQGLDPIPVGSDQLASMSPPQTDESQQQPAQDMGDVAAQQPSTNPVTPGDQELQSMQAQGFKMPTATNQPQQTQLSQGMPTPPDEQPGAQSNAPTPDDTAQKLLMAKQMTYDALMKERANTVSQMNDATPETLGKIFDDRSLPGKLGMIAGLMLGGLSSGMTGKSNPVLDMYNQTINNELKAQQLNMAQKQNLLSNNLAMTGHIDDATKLAKVNFMDHQMHQLTQLAQKYPNNPNIQANLQALGMMGAQSSANLMDNVAANVAWRHAASQIADPLQKIQFNPMLTPEQKQAAIKDYGTYQNMQNAKTNILNAFDQVSRMSLAERMTPAGSAKVDALIEPGLAQAVKDSEGRITPQDVPMIRAIVKPSKLPGVMGGKNVQALQRQQLAKFMSSKMNFPNLSLAGVNVQAPPAGRIPFTPGQ